MNNCQITYIYALYELGKENEIRYVGKSDNPSKRLRDHKNDNRTTSYKSCWIKSVTSNGGDIGLKVLKAVDQRNWKYHEIDVIREMKKIYNLVNLTDGGDGRLTNIYNKTFDECRLWVKLNKPEWVGGIKEYKKWSKMSEFPEFLPKAPDVVFSDWTTWGDYLCTGNIQSSKKKDFYLSYDESKKFLKENYNLKSSTDFRKCKMPTFIPKKPFNIYLEWIGWEDFLDFKSNIRKRNIDYMDFESARMWIKDNYGKITAKEYRAKCKNDTLVDFLPKKPENYYDNFKWSEFLFSNGKRRSKNFYMGFQQSREIIRKMNLKTNMEWRRWCKNKPDDLIRIPSSPEQVYDEWVSWQDWLKG